MYAGINQKVAPVRFFFLIKPDNTERFQRAMELAWSIWGGGFAPIFGFYENFSKNFRHEFMINISEQDYYRNLLGNFDPDIILYDADLPEDNIKKLAGEREVKTIESYMAEHNDGLFDHALTTLEIAQYLLNNEFKFLRSDDMVLSIPKIAPENILLKSLVGDIPSAMRDKVERLYEDNAALEQPNLTWDNLEAHVSNQIMNLIDLNFYKLRSWTNRPQIVGSAIYFMRTDRLQDIINFWNLRAASWRVVPLPIDLLEKSYFKNFVGRFTEWAIGRDGGQMASITLLIGYGLTQKQVDEAWSTVKPDTPKLAPDRIIYQGWFPRFWAHYEIQSADHVKSDIPYYDAAYDSYDVLEGVIEFKAMSLPFFEEWNLARKAAYKVILDLSIKDELADYAELLTNINDSQLRRLLSPLDFGHWRLSSAGIHRTVVRDDDRIRISLPKAVEFFKQYFSNTGHKLSETPNSKLARQVLKNIGGLYIGKFMLRAGHLKIIELFEGGKEISYAQLVAEIKKTLQLEKLADVKAFIGRLIEDKIIELGAQIQCEVCEQRGFFLPDTIAGKMTCPICRNQFTLPMADPTAIVWHYRGIGPFSRANKADGVMAVFATLSLFESEFSRGSGKISSLLGFELKKSKKDPQTPKEVDLCLLIQNGRDEYKEHDLIFCECKTYKRFTELDIERMKQLGDEFPGAILVMATLNENLNNDEIAQLISLVKYFQKGNAQRPVNPVLILTGVELLPNDYFEAFKVYEDKIKPYHRYNDYIGALSEFSIKEHLKIKNWWDIRDQVW